MTWIERVKEVANVDPKYYGGVPLVKVSDLPPRGVTFSTMNVDPTETSKLAAKYQSNIKVTSEVKQPKLLPRKVITTKVTEKVVCQPTFTIMREFTICTVEIGHLKKCGVNINKFWMYLMRTAESCKVSNNKYYWVIVDITPDKYWREYVDSTESKTEMVPF